MHFCRCWLYTFQFTCFVGRIELNLLDSHLTMTVHKAGSGSLNANGVPLPPTEAQVLKNGLPSTLPDIDVCPVSL